MQNFDIRGEVKGAKEAFCKENLLVISSCFAVLGNTRNSHQPSMNIYGKEAAFVSIYYCSLSSVFLNWFVLFILLVEGKLMKQSLELFHPEVLPSHLVNLRFCALVSKQMFSWFSRDLGTMVILVRDHRLHSGSG